MVFTVDSKYRDAAMAGFHELQPETGYETPEECDEINFVMSKPDVSLGQAMDEILIPGKDGYREEYLQQTIYRLWHLFDGECQDRLIRNAAEVPRLAQSLLLVATFTTTPQDRVLLNSLRNKAPRFAEIFGNSLASEKRYKNVPNPEDLNVPWRRSPDKPDQGQGT